MNAFSCRFAARSTACVFDHCNIGIFVFFIVISRWFVMHFGVILHDFVHPSGCLISVYEWSSEQLKTRNFHHFLKRFLYGKNTVTRDVSWIFWQIRQKLDRKKVIHFRAICTRVSCFLTFSCDLEKNVIRGTICEWAEYNLGFQRPPKNDQKMTLPRM